MYGVNRFGNLFRRRLEGSAGCFAAINGQASPSRESLGRIIVIARSSIRQAILLASLFAACGVRAQMFSPDYAFNGAPMSNFLSSSYLLNRQIVKNSSEGSSSGTPSQSAPTTVSPGPDGLEAASVPRKLAARYPEASRAEAERVFREVLAVYYPKIAAQFGIPPNDVAGATAAFIAGSYIAYRDIDLPEENFKALVAQMRRILGNNASFQSASAAQKQEAYEEMAIVGTTLALIREELKSQPDAQTRASIREVGKGYLEQFLSTDANRVEITARGLEAR
jgi:hypothetical protein